MSFTNNYSYYAVPAMWFVNMSAHWYAAGLSFTSNDMPPFDNCSPREFLDKVKGLEKQSPAVKRYIRAGLFAAAITAGNTAGLSSSLMNKFAASYLVSRVLYSLLYINVTKRSLSGLRSLSYVTGVGICCTIFVKAANKLNATLKF